MIRDLVEGRKWDMVICRKSVLGWGSYKYIGFEVEGCLECLKNIKIINNFREEWCVVRMLVKWRIGDFVGVERLFLSFWFYLGIFIWLLLLFDFILGYYFGIYIF